MIVLLTVFVLLGADTPPKPFRSADDISKTVPKELLPHNETNEAKTPKFDKDKLNEWLDSNLTGKSIEFVPIPFHGVVRTVKEEGEELLLIQHKATKASAADVGKFIINVNGGGVTQIVSLCLFEKKAQAQLSRLTKDDYVVIRGEIRFICWEEDRISRNWHYLVIVDNCTIRKVPKPKK